ncbi:hypothetical protein [Hazenella coriacea]|nr:hypothetical protein [Hazenella coriacea]
MRTGIEFITWLAVEKHAITHKKAINGISVSIFSYTNDLYSMIS